MRSFLAVASVLTTAIGVAACGSTTTKTVTVASTETETVTVPIGDLARDSTTETAAAPATHSSHGTGKHAVAKSGGITLRVLSAHTSPTVHYIGGTQDADVTPNATAVTDKAPQGGHYEYVRTRVTNNTPEGIDLTCEDPVTAAVLDGSGREFDPVDGLYLIAGNPGCNKMLQPGFKDEMTWVFLLPKGAHAETFSFTDTTDFNADEDPADVKL
jgi:hypothetical protein